MGNLKQGKMTKHNFESVFYKIIKADRYVVQMGQISVDRAAIGVVALAIGLGLLVFIETPEQPTRLSRFVAEHVVHFGIVDSLPLRLAFLSFFGALVAGGLFLRMADGTGRRLLEARRRQRWIELATGALIILHIVALSRSGMALPFSVTPLADAIYLAYGACAAVFIWNHRLPWQVVLAAILFIVLLAWWPATTGLMSRVHAPGMSLIDEHFAALFSGGQMLDFGYQLFLDVPARYGILTPIAIASAIRAGVEFDLGRLLHLVEFFQVLTFLLFIGSAWALTRGSEPRSRLVAVLLVVLVSAPLSFARKSRAALPEPIGLPLCYVARGSVNAHVATTWFANHRHGPKRRGVDVGTFAQFRDWHSNLGRPWVRMVVPSQGRTR